MSLELLVFANDCFTSFGQSILARHGVRLRPCFFEVSAEKVVTDADDDAGCWLLVCLGNIRSPSADIGDQSENMPQRSSVSQVKSACARWTSWTAPQTDYSILLELPLFQLCQGLAADALLMALKMANRTMREAHRRIFVFGAFDLFLAVLVLGEQAAAGATGPSLHLVPNQLLLCGLRGRARGGRTELLSTGFVAVLLNPKEVNVAS